MPYSYLVLRLSMVLALLSLLNHRSDAFARHHRSFSSSVGGSRQRVPCLDTRRPPSASVLCLSKNNNDEPNSPYSQRTTKVEDGSPLGVAIVVLGSLILLNNDQWEADTTAFGVIAGTASLAAGASRLVRYYLKKQNEMEK